MICPRVPYRLPLAALAVSLASLSPAPAAAGEIAFDFTGGTFQLAAEKTASAVYDSKSAPVFGGAVRYTVWRGAFVSAGARTFSRDGERVFVANAGAPVQKLGFPLSMRTTPWLVTAGYRYPLSRLVAPYALVGAAITKYRVTSEVTGQPFDEDASKTGFHGAFGVEVGGRHLRLGGEVAYTSVTGVIGDEGVSQVYGEDDIGGLQFVGKLVVAFGGR